MLQHSEQKETDKTCFRRGVVGRKIVTGWGIVMVACVENGLVHWLFCFADLSADSPVSDLSIDCLVDLVSVFMAYGE